MKAQAFIPAYNEADILPWTVRHLIRQGLSVHVIDCWSTDDTAAVASEAGATIERFPSGPVQRIRWRDILTRVEECAAHSDAEWCVYCDADELRCVSKTPSRFTLLDAFELADYRKWTAYNHLVYTYHPSDNGFDGSQDPEKYFQAHTRDIINERIGQVKAWRNLGPVQLAWSGGHQVRFTGYQLAEGYLVTKHYPIRSQQHGERKIFEERRKRWADPEADWHIQYAGIEPGHNFLVQAK